MAKKQHFFEHIGIGGEREAYNWTGYYFSRWANPKDALRACAGEDFMIMWTNYAEEIDAVREALGHGSPDFHRARQRAELMVSNLQLTPAELAKLADEETWSPKRWSMIRSAVGRRVYTLAECVTLHPWKLRDWIGDDAVSKLNQLKGDYSPEAQSYRLEQLAVAHRASAALDEVDQLMELLYAYERPDDFFNDPEIVRLALFNPAGLAEPTKKSPLPLMEQLFATWGVEVLRNRAIWKRWCSIESHDERERLRSFAPHRANSDGAPSKLDQDIRISEAFERFRDEAKAKGSRSPKADALRRVQIEFNIATPATADSRRKRGKKRARDKVQKAD